MRIPSMLPVKTEELKNCYLLRLPLGALCSSLAEQPFLYYAKYGKFPWRTNHKSYKTLLKIGPEKRQTGVILTSNNQLIWIQKNDKHRCDSYIKQPINLDPKLRCLSAS